MPSDLKNFIVLVQTVCNALHENQNVHLTFFDQNQTTCSTTHLKELVITMTHRRTDTTVLAVILLWERWGP